VTYVTSRGQWYDVSWKGSEERSGGIASNIGVHFFDLLLWLFGDVSACAVHLAEPRRMAGQLELERATVRWFLSTDRHDLPFVPTSAGSTTFRSIVVDGEDIEFTEGFTDLHTRVYEEVFAGRGFRVPDARPAIKLVHQVRHANVVRPTDTPHPLLSAR